MSADPDRQRPRSEVVAHPHRNDPAAVAAAAVNAFRGRRLTIGRSSRVHAVTWRDWIAEHQLPAPACRQGFAGHGTHAELQPTELPVSCRRCLRLRPEEAPTTSRQDVLLGLDELES